MWELPWTTILTVGKQVENITPTTKTIAAAEI